MLVVLPHSPFSGDHGLEGFRLQLVLPNPAFVPQHHHVQEVEHVQVSLLRRITGSSESEKTRETADFDFTHQEESQ